MKVIAALLLTLSALTFNVKAEDAKALAYTSTNNDWVVLTDDSRVCDPLYKAIGNVRGAKLEGCWYYNGEDVTILWPSGQPATKIAPDKWYKVN